MLHSSRVALLALSLVCINALVAASTAAPKLELPAASPASTLKQRVGVTDVEISYSRPSMKGRKIFGGLIPYGEVWRTGANSATKLSFSSPVKVNGTQIDAGKYELFTIPGPDGWTVIIHKDTSAWGAYTYDAKNDVARVNATPVSIPEAIESFTIGLSDLRDESATLYLAWENTRVPVKLEVDGPAQLAPRIEAFLSSAAEKKPYAQAAVYYLEHDLDLNKAATWIDAAISAEPDAFYYIYQKARILAKKGDKAGAIAAAQQSIAGANNAPAALKAEYVRLNEALIANLKK